MGVRGERESGCERGKREWGVIGEGEWDGCESRERERWVLEERESGC